ncbi:MAG: hypothetical protein KAV00_16435 [Phycisphaerae bacterium]|nr:hypothetical protein [Phycisphaerae bacterium]
MRAVNMSVVCLILLSELMMMSTGCSRDGNEASDQTAHTQRHTDGPVQRSGQAKPATMSAAKTITGEAVVSSVDGTTYRIKFTLRNSGSQAVTIDLGPLQGQMSDGSTVTLSQPGVAMVACTNEKWTTVDFSLKLGSGWQPLHHLEPGESMSASVEFEVHQRGQMLITAGAPVAVELTFYDEGRGSVRGKMIVVVPTENSIRDKK